MLRLSVLTAAAMTALPDRGLSARKGSSGSRFGAVASEPAIAQIGQRILAEGGNAMDAAVGSAFAAGIIIPSKTGIGGYGGAMTIALPDGKVSSIDFNSTAPASATPDMFPMDARGNVIGRKNFHGWLAAGVPGTCAGLGLGLKRYGSRSLREALQPAIALAKSQKKEDRYVRFPALAQTLTALAERDSVDSFYRGDIAEEIASSFKKNGGLVTAKDLAAYQPIETEPYRLNWGDYAVYTAPLGASGLVTLQALSILHGLKWGERKWAPGEATHARVEALRLAWKDRGDLFGDPQFVKVPVEKLLSPDYAIEQAARVEAAVKARKAMPLQVERIEIFGTLHISAVDARGMFVSLTLTQGGSYGAQVSIDSLGMVLGHGMSRFDPRPGHPNSVAPHKRPLHNMSPSVLLKGNTPLMSVGAAGGTKIPNALFDFFTHCLAGGKTMEQALNEPRLNCFGQPVVKLEKSWPIAERDYLKAAGFEMQEGPGATASAVFFEKGTTARGFTRLGNPFQDGESEASPR
jgi:gamma-glutamyltranspeptidase/glutathione hydrolase